MSGLEGKVAIVTGASSGIGRSVALAFAAAGANVMVADRDEEGGRETVALGEGPGELRFHATDVASAESVAGLVDATVSAYGRLDCAHNNAGITLSGSSTADVTLEDWHRVIDVDLTGVFLCLKYEIPAMLATGGGAIVNTASSLGLVGIAGQPAYVAAKHGVVGLTKAAALEYATQGIRVNSICPGVVRTPLFEAAAAGDPAVLGNIEALHPMGRLGQPEEIADAVLWLCSDAASFVTGHALAVDGGFIVP